MTDIRMRRAATGIMRLGATQHPIALYGVPRSSRFSIQYSGHGYRYLWSQNQSADSERWRDEVGLVIEVHVALVDGTQEVGENGTMPKTYVIPTLVAFLNFTAGVSGAFGKVGHVAVCDTCRLVVQRVGALTLKNGKGLPLPSSITEGPGGSIWYGSYDAAPPLHFSHGGQEEGKLVAPGWMGAFGAGMIITAGDRDSLILYEPGLQRVTIADSRGVIARTMLTDVEHGNAIACNDDGIFVISGSVPTREKAGFPLHFLSRDGSILRSASVGPPLSLGYSPLNAQLVARASDGGFWTVDAERDIIHRWDHNGRLLHEFVRRVRWFPTRALYPTKVSLTEPPLPTVVAIRQVSGGRLLLLTLVAGANWRGAVEEKTDRFGKQSAAVTNFDEYVDTMVELVDPKNAKTIAWRRLRGFFPYIIDDEEIAHVIPSAETGTAAVEIWHVNLNLKP